MRRLLPSSIWLATVVGATSVLGQQEGDSVRLEYSADMGCPDRAAFVAEVEARTPRARFDDRGPGARAITVAAHVAAGRARGIIDVGAGAPREISAENCADVVSALALVTALVIDPDAIVAPLPPVGLPPAAPPASDVTPPVATPPVAAVDAPIPEPAARAADATSSDRPPPPIAPSPWSSASPVFGAGARFEASVGLANQGIAMFGPSAWFEGGARLSGVFVPTLRLVGRAAFSPTVTAQEGSAHFRLLAGQVDACPLRFELGRVAVVPCLSLEVGALQAIADTAPAMVTPQNANRTWLAFDQSVAVELPAAGPVYVAFVAQLREPLSGYDFVFGTNPDIPIANLHGVQLGVGLGGGVHFW